MALPLEDYGFVGDLQTGALVGRDGSIDWLCLPRFDSGACFAALLGTDQNGRWRLAPRGADRAARWRYRQETLVLETEFDTRDGTVRIIDFMPLRTVEPDLVRIVEGVSGRVEMEMDLGIRFDYGSIVPWVRRQDGLLTALAGPDGLVLRTPAPIEGEDLRTVASFAVEAGERVPFVLAWFPSSERPPDPPDAERALAETEAFWRDWASGCSYRGRWREAVVRSLIVLKALTYAPTGGMVAAATTSLPEQVGGERNWDYRFCWLRDATFTLDALLAAGYADEAKAWNAWLARAAAGDPAHLQIMYGLGGERRLTELELGWLDGYESSRPVRIGNAASEQFQLDVYGEVVDAFHEAQLAGIEPDGWVWGFLRQLVDFVEQAWREPDQGLWEVRGPARHFTHSKVMAWVAIDRAIKEVEQLGRDDVPLDRWRRLRAEIHQDVCERGYDPELGSFVQSYGSKELDASLLALPLVGFLPADDPRVHGTVEAIRNGLVADGLVRRYLTHEAVHEIDGLAGREGTFIVCSFWLADALIVTGRADEARALFERLLEMRNDLGLLAEEYETHSGRLIGNFPQAYSHVGVVNTALGLEGAALRRGRD